jgi:hypothetical protein
MIEAPSVETLAELGGCQNCGAALHGAFCSACGQKRPGRLTVRAMFSELAHTVTHLDSSILRTLIGLTTKPGRVCLDYIDGKRKAYMNPAKYAFLTVTAYVLLMTFLHVNIWPPFAGRRSPASEKMFNLILNLSSYRLFVVLLLMAAIQRLLFRRSRHNFAECYVFNLFVFGHWMLIFFILASPGIYSTWPGYAFIQVTQLFYLTWALIDFYGAKLLPGVGKALIISIASFLFNAITGFLIALAVRVWR